jgi:hypothetical protein
VSPDQPEEYCAPLFPHLVEVCQGLFGTQGVAYFAASSRQTCRALPVPDERNCLLAIEDCSEEDVIACNVPNRIFGCDADGSCPGGLVCDPEAEQCAECMTPDDCAGGEACEEGYCLPPEYVLAPASP